MQVRDNSLDQQRNDVNSMKENNSGNILSTGTTRFADESIWSHG